MDIFLLKRKQEAGYDEVQALVIVATDEAEARVTAADPPAGQRGHGDEGGGVWQLRSGVTCEKIGVAAGNHRKPFVICRNFFSA